MFSLSADPRHGTAPPGWDENPTSWRRRGWLGLLALAGLLVAAYLTLYQWDAWDVWDPFFDSPRVLDHAKPVPDALAGVLAYGTELLLLALGGRDRWRSLPWTCLALGAVLTMGAVVSIGLIIVQPTVAGAWCTLCLVSAALSLALFCLGIGEARAAWQYVREARPGASPSAMPCGAAQCRRRATGPADAAARADARRATSRLRRAHSQAR